MMLLWHRRHYFDICVKGAVGIDVMFNINGPKQISNDSWWSPICKQEYFSWPYYYYYYSTVLPKVQPHTPCAWQNVFHINKQDCNDTQTLTNKITIRIYVILTRGCYGHKGLENVKKSIFCHDTNQLKSSIYISVNIWQKAKYIHTTKFNCCMWI